jgi:hypothetical protein
MFFQIIGGTSVASLAPFTNGFALAVWSECGARVLFLAWRRRRRRRRRRRKKCARA